MKKVSFSFFLFLSMLVPVSAQIVSTLVPGPSTFNDGLAIDKDGNIYAALYYGTTVTKITPSGTTSIFASGFSSPNGIKFGRDGYLYVPNATSNKISKVSPEGVVSDFITISNPGELYFDSEGLLYVANYTNSSISVIDTSNNITLLYSGAPLNGPIGVLKDAAGTLYIGNFTDGKVFRIENGNTFVEIGDLPGWLGFMVLIGENIYATAYQNNRIYKIPIDGSGQSVFAGNGTAGGTDGDVLSASFNQPNGITATSTGDTLYISEYNPRRLRMITGVLNPTSVNHDESELVNKFSLEQNYPNPFNPSTKIKFTVGEAYYASQVHVSLRVYDAIGNEIATLVNESKPAGEYEITFDGNNLPSGVYIYKFEAAGVIETRKMLMIK
ncbi:MAG: T9SS type A sorting domain-containing protein [Ignavibacteriales bacterium]|nr:MAG: T9SS type A sorting domain-containing protein [Ignavibacteriales bacterium]